jgi:hypothetical protein
VLEKARVRVAASEEIDASHGCFDNAIEVLERTLKRINRVDESGNLVAPIDDLRGF